MMPTAPAPARRKPWIGRWQNAGRIAAGLLLLVAAFSIPFFLTGWVYGQIGRLPPAWAAQLINSLLGLMLMGLFLGLLARFFRSQQMNVFEPIIRALQQVAKGDFSTRLPDLQMRDGMFSVLVSSVNSMTVELDQMEQMRQAFISNVSHEIQSPLTSIRGFARALQADDLDDATRQHYLSIIETESVRLSKLSDNLLALASLEANSVQFTPLPYRLDKQLRQLILACEPQWLAKGLELDADLDEATLTADEDLLSQVWLNLLHNSIKFTPAGGSVRVALRQVAGQVEVTVTDSGCGIAPEDQPHIFERVYRADRARARAGAGGNGLGLSIAQKIVALHGGQITVSSPPGAGAQFTVRLPASAV